MEVYVVISRFNKRDDWTSIGISSEVYTTKKDAIEFCKSRLTEEELEHDRKMKARNMRCWYEFYSKNYTYEIKVLTLKMPEVIE